MTLVRAVLAALALALTPPSTGTTGGQPATCLLAKVNALRVSKALGPVRLDGELARFAQSWSDHMGAVNVLDHNPTLADAPGNWSRAGENVGVGPDLDALFDAFVASPAHYANLVDPGFDRVGIGITLTPGGLVYTTEDFEVGRGIAPAVPEGPPPAAAGSLGADAIRCGYPPVPTAPLRIQISIDQTRGFGPG